MSMLGNSTFTSVQNLASPLAILDVSSLTAINATIGNLTITGNLTIAGDIEITGNLTIDGQIRASDGTAAVPSYSFTNDQDTGMYRPGNNQIGFSTAGTLRAGITNNGISVDGGTPLLPTYNFGIALDVDTGMYRAQTNTIGFSTGGVLKASIFPSSVGDFIEGLNVGLTTNIAGIRRLSATAANSWEDGNCGNSEFIVFTAADFMSFTATTARTSTFVTYSAAGAADSPVVYNATNAGAALASKLIPKGFIIADGENCNIWSDIATGVGVPQQMVIDVRVSSAADSPVAAVQIASATIGAGAPAWINDGVSSINRTAITIGGLPATATGTGFNTVNILVTPSTAAMSATTGGILGFRVPIERI